MYRLAVNWAAIMAMEYMLMSHRLRLRRMVRKLTMAGMPCLAWPLIF